MTDGSDKNATCRSFGHTAMASADPIAVVWQMVDAPENCQTSKGTTSKPSVAAMP
jgi:hypothetical protein